MLNFGGTGVEIWLKRTLRKEAWQPCMCKSENICFDLSIQRRVRACFHFSLLIFVIVLI